MLILSVMIKGSQQIEIWFAHVSAQLSFGSRRLKANCKHRRQDLPFTLLPFKTLQMAPQASEDKNAVIRAVFLRLLGLALIVLSVLQHFGVIDIHLPGQPDPDALHHALDHSVHNRVIVAVLFVIGLNVVLYSFPPAPRLTPAEMVRKSQ